MHTDFTITLPITHTSQNSINNTFEAHKHEILLPKVILRLTSVSHEETAHTIPSHTPKRFFTPTKITSFSLPIILYI